MINSYLDSINKSLLKTFKSNSKVYIFGEDILDPYGGAFNVTKNLSSLYPNRVITTPISEAAITGIGAGMAMRGFLPIIEIMFGDFMTLTFDQIVNGITKFRQMYNFKVQIPIVIRTPMGGGRGYGPTHSQSIEKYFLGIPNLKVVAPSHFHDCGELLKKSILEDKSPILFIENKLLYNEKLILESDKELALNTIYDKLGYPVSIVKNYHHGEPDVLIISYGGLSKILEKLLRDYIFEEINIILFLPSLISSIPISVLKQPIKECSKIIIAEEGNGPFGWSAEFASSIYDNFSGMLSHPIKRLYAKDTVIPAAKHLERNILLSREDIEKSIEEIIL